MTPLLLNSEYVFLLNWVNIIQMTDQVSIDLFSPLLLRYNSTETGTERISY